MEFFKIRRTIPFMRYALVFNIISIITFLAAVFFLATRHLNLSIEFTGGTVIEAAYKQSANVDQIRQSLEKHVKTLPGVNTLHVGADTPTRLMLPVVPMSQVRKFKAPSGQCPYAKMRCIAG